MTTTYTKPTAEVYALGQTWTLSAWDAGVWREFLAWARAKLPDPLATGKKVIDAFPATAHDAVVRQSLFDACMPLVDNSPGVQHLLAGHDGASYMLWLLLRPNHPGVTQDDAYAIGRELGEEGLRPALARVRGEKVEGAAR